MNKKYMAVLISLDGSDYVCDYYGDGIENVWENVEDGGSRWIFYPIPFITRDDTSIKNRRIVSACDGLEFLTNKTIKTAMKFIRDNPEYIKTWLSY